MEEAQHGEMHNGGEVEGINGNQIEKFSEATRRTIQKIRLRYTRPRKAILCTLHDNTSPGYEWLLPGWVAEERHMESGKIYRYYYDPGANFYPTKTEVILTWEQNGFILVDN